MPERSADEIKDAIERHIELWNSKDRAAWLQHWQSRAPGGYALEDPVGTPVKRGYELLGVVWDRAFDETAWTITMKQCIVCGHEAALVMVNEGAIGGVPVAVEGI